MYERIRSTKAAIMLGCCALLSVRAEPPPLDGTWLNPDQKTGGITKLEIAKGGDKWTVHAWGRCQPEDCDWGVVELKPLVSGPGSTDVTHALAVWEQKHATQHMLMRIEHRQLLVENATMFKDDSKRLDFRDLYLLKRLPAWETNQVEQSSGSMGGEAAARNELTKWQGSWETGDGERLTIKGNRWTSSAPGFGPVSGALKVIQMREALTLVDLLVEEGPTKGQTCKMILRPECDTLYYCGTYGAVRPAKFKNVGENVYYVWKRTQK